MNNEMAYLLGMICGNGEIKRGNNETTISVEIPHKLPRTAEFHDIPLYVRASITTIRGIVEPLIGNSVHFTQNLKGAILSFTKPNEDYLIREIIRYTNFGASHNNMKINEDIFNFSIDEIKQFLRGFADTTAYIRSSNALFGTAMHRVYIEIPSNWNMVITVCNLLKMVDIPVQNIDWAHPNIRDGNMTKYNNGQPNFWKKEHQIKIYANEFETIGFTIEHKKIALEKYANELRASLPGDAALKTHKYYWETRERNKIKPHRPDENDSFIPVEIRGKHYNSWKEIAKDLGYAK